MNAGLSEVHTRLDFSELFENLGPDDELLWLDAYFPGDAEFIGKIRPALERGAKTRMLLIDPRSSNAFAQDIEVFIRRVSSVRCSLKKLGLKPEACQILAYDDLPCMPMYIVTHKGIPVRGYSSSFLSGGVLENMHDYFEQKWERNLRLRDTSLAP